MEQGHVAHAKPELYKSMKEAGAYHPRLLHALRQRKKDKEEEVAKAVKAVKVALKPDGAHRVVARSVKGSEPETLGGTAKRHDQRRSLGCVTPALTEEETVHVAVKST